MGHAVWEGGAAGFSHGMVEAEVFGKMPPSDALPLQCLHAFPQSRR